MNGPSVRSMIYRSAAPSLSHDDICAVTESLSNSVLTNGINVERFENELADYCGARFAVAVSSGTSALHLSCVALGLKAGDIAWTSALTFAASANVIRHCGAEVEFLDVHQETLNIDPEQLAIKLKVAKDLGRLPKVLIVVHFAGLPCDMAPIIDICKRFGVMIIEDACHAIGGSYRGRKIGGCADGVEAVCYSFHPAKNMTAGEGGSVFTDNPELAEKIKRMRVHGIAASGDPSEPWRREMLVEGFNCRMTEMQASLGRSQLRQLDQFVSKRTALVELYKNGLRHLPVAFQKCTDTSIHAHHLFPVRFDFRQMGVSKLQFFNRAKELGVELIVQYYPVPLHYYYKTLGYGVTSYPNSQEFYQQSFCLPLHPNLEKSDINEIVRRIERCALSRSDFEVRI